MKDFKVLTLPSIGEPDSRYYVPIPSTNFIEEYVTDKHGYYKKVSSGTTSNNYVYSQDVASNIWLINHGLGYYPAVSVTDSAGKLVIGGVQYIDINTIQISFSAGFSGKVYLS